MKFLYIFLLLIFAGLTLVSGAMEIVSNANTQDNFVINMEKARPINYSLVPTVNSSDYWDNLDTPADINTGDLTDDNTYVEVAGDTMSGNLDMDGNQLMLNDWAYFQVVGSDLIWLNINPGGSTILTSGGNFDVQALAGTDFNTDVRISANLFSEDTSMERVNATDWTNITQLYNLTVDEQVCDSNGCIGDAILNDTYNGYIIKLERIESNNSQMLVENINNSANEGKIKFLAEILETGTPVESDVQIFESTYNLSKATPNGVETAGNTFRSTLYTPGYGGFSLAGAYYTGTLFENKIYGSGKVGGIAVTTGTKVSSAFSGNYEAQFGFGFRGELHEVTMENFTSSSSMNAAVAEFAFDLKNTSIGGGIPIIDIQADLDGPSSINWLFANRIGLSKENDVKVNGDVVGTYSVWASFENITGDIFGTYYSLSSMFPNDDIYGHYVTIKSSNASEFFGYYADMNNNNDTSYAFYSAEGHIAFDTDDDKIYFGEDQDAWQTWDGTNFIFNQTGNGIWTFYNSTGLGEIRYGHALTSTTINKDEDVLSKFKLGSELVDKDGNPIHENFGECYKQVEEKDFDNCEEVLEKVSYCFDDMNMTLCTDNIEKIPKGVDYTTEEYYKTECGTKLVSVVDLTCMDAMQSQAIPLLRNRIIELEQENQLIKDELCLKDNTYSWCVTTF